MRRSKRIRDGIAFNAVSLLDLFMLGVLVFAMNADTAEKKYIEQLADATQKLDSASRQLECDRDKYRKERAALTNRIEEVSIRAKKGEMRIDALLLKYSDATNALMASKAKGAALQEDLKRSQIAIADLEASNSKLKADYTGVSNALSLARITVANLRDSGAKTKNEMAKLEDRLKESLAFYKDATNALARANVTAKELREGRTRAETENEELKDTVTSLKADYEGATNALASAKKENDSVRDEVKREKMHSARLGDDIETWKSKCADATNALEISKNATAKLRENERKLNERAVSLENKFKDEEASHSITKSRLKTSDAKNGELREENKKSNEEILSLRSQVKKWKDRCDRAEENYKILERSTEKGGDKLLVSVCMSTTGKIFLKNNKTWLCCPSLQEFDGFYKKLSIPQGVQVFVSFIGFYNCHKREEDLVYALKNKFGPDNVANLDRHGTHLVCLDNNEVRIDEVDNVVSLGGLARVIGNLGKEDDSLSTKYYVIWPSTDERHESVRNTIAEVYGARPFEIEIIKY